MNKKYMDFVPAKSGKMQGTSKLVTTKIVEEEILTVTSEDVFVSDDLFLDKVDNSSARFVRTDVPKRPLSQKPLKREPLTAGDALAAMKAQDIRAKKNIRPPKRAKKITNDMAGMALDAKTKKDIYQTPKTQFINQEKIVKRPLSRNIYLKEIEKNDEVVAKEPKNIVIASSKPEKKSKLKTFFAIVLTIIVGAAAGAVAFLLLPK